MAQLFYCPVAEQHHVFVAGAHLHHLVMDAVSGILRVGQFKHGLWTCRHCAPIAEVSGWCAIDPDCKTLYVAVR
eukprot:SAG31_NODE_32385_length_356_cov_1.206226_1_plen_73_part_10